MRPLVLLTIGLAISVPLLQNVAAAELTAHIKYLSASTIYLDVGATDSVKPGDKGRIIRDGVEVATLEITYTASHTAACRIVETRGDVKVGDTVIMESPAAAAPTEISAPPEMTRAATSDAELVRRVRQERGTHWSGRLGFDYYAQIPVGDAASDWNQPSLSLNGRVDNIARSPLQLNIRLRARRLNRTGSNANNRWNSRLYELSLAFARTGSSYQWSLGRIQPLGVSGVGYLDGATFGYSLREDWRCSFFTGAEPNPVTSDVNTDKLKVGSLIAWSSPAEKEYRLASSLALVGVYNRGEIDREYLYLRNGISSTHRLTVDQSAEVQINRGWRKDAAGSSLEVSSFLLSAHYAAAEWLNLSGGFDQWRSVRGASDKAIPDSLWVGAARSGWRMGLDARLTSELRAYLSGRIGEGKGTSGNSASGGVSFRDRRWTRITARFSGAGYSSTYSEGGQGSLSLSRAFYGLLDVSAEYGISQNRLKTWRERSDSHWLNFSADAWLARGVYLSGSYEITRGDNPAADRLLLSGGIRF